MSSFKYKITQLRFFVGKNDISLYYIGGESFQKLRNLLNFLMDNLLSLYILRIIFPEYKFEMEFRIVIFMFCLTFKHAWIIKLNEKI